MDNIIFRNFQGRPIDRPLAPGTRLKKLLEGNIPVLRNYWEAEAEFSGEARRAAPGYSLPKRLKTDFSQRQRRCEKISGFCGRLAHCNFMTQFLTITFVME